MREGLVADLQCPRHHFLPPANWMKEPNGINLWKGASITYSINIIYTLLALVEDKYIRDTRSAEI